MKYVGLNDEWVQSWHWSYFCCLSTALHTWLHTEFYHLFCKMSFLGGEGIYKQQLCNAESSYIFGFSFVPWPWLEWAQFQQERIWAESKLCSPRRHGVPENLEMSIWISGLSWNSSLWGQTLDNAWIYFALSKFILFCETVETEAESHHWWCKPGVSTEVSPDWICLVVV